MDRALVPQQKCSPAVKHSTTVKYQSFQSSVWEHTDLEVAGLVAEPAVPAQDGHPQESKAKGSREGEERGLQQ